MPMAKIRVVFKKYLEQLWQVSDPKYNLVVAFAEAAQTLKDASLEAEASYSGVN